MSLQDRARGALLGLACGDAVGTTVEFAARGTFPPVTDMVGGGPFRLQPGQWTDDTTMAVCLADSLVACRGFDPADQLRRYVRWWHEGHNSPTGTCFDIGGTTRASLAEFERTGEPYRALHPQNGGNGSLMRLAPIPIAYPRPAAAAELQGLTTHASLEASAACRVYALAMRRALEGATRAEALDPKGLGDDLPPAIAAIVAGSYRDKPETLIRSGGYVVESLEAALWCVWRAADFEEAVLLATNLGHDADTTAAITGQLAGSLWGQAGIPPAWLAKLWRRADLTTLADQLMALDLA